MLVFAPVPVAVPADNAISHTSNAPGEGSTKHNDGSKDDSSNCEGEAGAGSFLGSQHVRPVVSQLLLTSRKAIWFS